MNNKLNMKHILFISIFCVATPSVTVAEISEAPEATPAELAMPFREVTDLNKAYLSAAPKDRNDGITTGQLGIHGGNKKMIVKLAKDIAAGQHGKFDSLLIAHKDQLVFESYYLRGRINLPHPQASATKAYTGLALGRAIQLGHLSMEDLDKPLTHFLKDLDPTQWVEGVENITLNKALTMRSGIRLTDEQDEAIDKQSKELSGQKHVQAYLESSESISPETQTFKYQNDPMLVMQVIDAVVPGNARDFINDELLNQMGISNYRWRTDYSGLPTAGSRASLTSRGMLKFGLLAKHIGKWEGEQLIPEDYIKVATDRIFYTGDEDFHYGGDNTSGQGYGYYWWSADLKYGDKSYFSQSAQGGWGQFIVLIEELDLLVVMTAHDNDTSYLQIIAEHILPAFVRQN